MGSRVRSENEQILIGLADLQVTFGRPALDRSLILDEGAGKVLPLFTNKALMTRWWLDRSEDELPTRSMTFRTMLANWRAADVDIVLNPGNEMAIRIPITEARKVLGVATTKLEPGVEPLPVLQLPRDQMAFTRNVIIPVGSLVLVAGGVLSDLYLFVILGAILFVVSMIDQVRRYRSRPRET